MTTAVRSLLLLLLLLSFLLSAVLPGGCASDASRTNP